ncbi:MAG TPA: glycosyltransferase family A protein [Steroidobacteraceae bacterium]|jgi:glycosyltransferase involved in cell wall biosynthesis
MVTKGTPERLPGILTSIACFKRQTHAPLELVIVTDSKDPNAPSRVEALVKSIDAPGVRTVGGKDGMTLGALRNLSMQLSAGALLCQWDDDDFHHPERVADQVTSLTNGDAMAVLLEDMLQYYPTSRRLWWLNWRATEARGHPGTLLCRRECGISYPEVGQDSVRGEDLAVARQLIAAGALATLRDKPYLYVYVSHGQNTYEIEHHQMLTARLGVSRGRIARHERQLRLQLAAFEPLLNGANIVAPNADEGIFPLSAPD